MEPQNPNTTPIPPIGDDSQSPPSLAVAPEPVSPELLSSDPSGSYSYTPDIMPANPQKGKFRRLMRLFLKWGAVAIAVVALIGVGVLLVWSSRREAARLTTANPSDSFETQTVPLDSLAVDFAQEALVVRRVIVNGQLQVGEGMILTPSLQPSAPQPGQLYYDQNTNLLGYFNGTEFVYLDAVEIPDIVIHPSVEQIAGLTGQIGLGPGLTVAGGSLVNNGVISLGGSTGAIAVGAGLSIAGNVLQNSGVLNIVGGSGIQVTDDGSGTYTITNVGAGNGTVSSSGGTVGRIPVFTDVQNIENSLISQSGMTVTVSGDLHVVTGGLSLSNPLTVSNGGTGATSFAPNGVLIGNGTGPITAVTAPGPNLCLLSTAGAPIFTACPSASGVTTLNGLNGALTIANASAAGSIITIDNASTSAKGIAQFSSANFTDNGAGVINTIQDIHTGATPTFAGLNTNSINPSSALTVGAAGQTAFLQGSTATIAAASGDIVLTSAGQIRLTGFNCSAFANGGTLTTDASGNLICANDDGGPGGGVSSVNSLVGDLVLQGTAGQIVVTDNGSDTLTLSLASDVTLQGNTFNGANQLVQLNGFGQLPAVSGALLTNLNGSAISSGTIDNARLVNGGELTVTAGTNLTGGGSVALGGTITLHVTDNPTFSGNVVVEGGIITLGTVGQVGSLVLHDGNGQTTTLQAGDSTGNLTFILPSSAGNVAQCLKQGGGNQLIWDDCEGGLGGISGVVSLNSLGGALTIQGTTNRIVVTDDGNDTITISAPQDIHTAASPTFAGLTLTGDVAVEGGTVTIGSTSQAASLVIHDGDGQTVTLEVGNLASDLTFILPATAGNSFQCLKKGAGNQLIWDDCEGGSGPSGVTSLNGLVAALTLQGTADQIVVSDDGVDTITLSLGAAVTLQGNTFNGANQLVQLNGSGELPALSGVNLTNLNASALTIGTVSSSVISGAYTGITGVGTISTGTWQGAAIAIAHGGTGATTQQGAINNLSGLTTQGDLLYHNGTNVTRLPRGNNGECLVSTATTIQWGSCLGGGALSGSGTPGTIAVFTDTDEIGDSILSQSGSAITVGGNLNITSGGQIQINGVPISSADLSDGGNLAKLNASQTFTGATVAFQNSSDSTNAFNIQNAAGVRVLTVNTTAGQVELGTAGVVNGSLVFYNANDNNTVTILSDALTSNRTILLPDADGTICLDTGNCADLGATLQTAYNFSLGGTTPKIKVNDTLLGVEIQDADISINDYLLTVRASNNSGLGQVMFGVNSAGEVVIQSSTNSSTALQLLTSAGTSVLAGDTLNGQVILGQGGTLTGALLFSNASNNNLITLTSQTATVARTITLPDASGTICLDTGNCLGGPAGGANTALSNLTGVAINTTLLPGIAGDVDLGSDTLPFGQLYLMGTGYAATFNATTGINTGAGSGTQRIDASGNLVNIGNITGSSTMTIQPAAGQGLTITAHGNSTWSTDNGNLSLQAAGELNLGNGGGTTINIGTNNATHTISIGTGTAAQTITVGSTNTTSSLVLNAGSGNITMNGLIILNDLGAADTTSTLCLNSSSQIAACTSAGMSIGTIDSQPKSADGAVISGTVLYLQTADTTYPGLVSVGTQTFAGYKTFAGNVDVGDFANLGSGSRLFSDGFESGDRKLWETWVTAGSSSVAVDTSNVNSGKYSLVITSNGGDILLARRIKPSKTVAMRVYVDLSSYTSGDWVDLFAVWAGEDSDPSHAEMAIYYNPDTGHLAHYCSTCAVTDAETSQAFAPGSGWHKIELVVTQGASDGTIDVYVDDQLVLSRTGQNTGSIPYNWVSLGNTGDGQATVYYDDVVVDTVRPGGAASVNIADSLHVSGTSTFGAGLAVLGGPLVVQDTDLSLGAQSAPVVAQTRVTTFGSSTTNHAVAMPSIVEKDDLLIVLLATDGNATVNDPDGPGPGGWQKLADVAFGGSGGVRGTVWAKEADGTEDNGGGTVNFQTSSGETAAAVVYRIPAGTWFEDADDLSRSVAVQSGTGATTDSPDPPALDPSVWDLENTLWIAFVAGSTYGGVSSYPEGYTNGIYDSGGSGSSGASIASAQYVAIPPATSEDPGTFTMNDSAASVAFTIAVRPARSTSSLLSIVGSSTGDVSSALFNVSSTGLVGIGTTDPEAFLHIKMNEPELSYPGLIIENTSNGAEAYASLVLATDVTAIEFGTGGSGSDGAGVLYIHDSALERDLLVFDEGNMYVGGFYNSGALLVLNNKTGSDPSGTEGGMYYNSTSGKFRCYTPDGWTDCQTSRTAYYSSDGTSTNSTSPVNVAGMGFPVNANTIYNFSCDIVYTSNSTAAGLGLGFTIGGSPSFISYTALIPFAANGTDAIYEGTGTSSGAMITAPSVVSTDPTKYIARIFGTVKTGSASTLQLVMNRGGASASNVNIRAGSACAVTRLGP